MKHYLAFFTVGLLGAVIGAGVAMAIYVGHLRVMIPSHLATLEEGQEQSCMLSLAVLTRLEAGDTDHAKAVLAREVGSWYRVPWQPQGPYRQKILELVEATKAKSAVLRDELARKDK
jgi:hypothetical protein